MKTSSALDRKIQRYMAARERMAKGGTPIPPRVLRGYLDALRVIQSMSVGEHYAKRLIITGQWLNGPRQALVRPILEEAISRGFVIDTKGESWQGI
jgi:hypothetical protein